MSTLPGVLAGLILANGSVMVWPISGFVYGIIDVVSIDIPLSLSLLSTAG